MTHRMTAILVLGLAAGAWGVALPLRAQDASLDSYLAADGKLKYGLEIRDERQRGQTAYGAVYRIEKDGRWTVSTMRGPAVAPTKDGTLKAAEIRKLAEALARLNVTALRSAGLPHNKQRRITVRFGDQQAVVVVPLPERFNPDRPVQPSIVLPPRAETVTAYTAVVDAVKQVLGVDPIIAQYLTADGKLTHPLEISEDKAHNLIRRDLPNFDSYPVQQTFYGITYRIDVDGKWTAAQIYRKEIFKQHTGKIDLDGMKSIAAVLEEMEVDSIRYSGTPNVNHHLVSFRFGSNQATMSYGVDLALAKPPGAPAKLPPVPNQPSAETVRRVSAIVEAVKGLVGVVPEPPTTRVLGPKKK